VAAAKFAEGIKIRRVGGGEKAPRGEGGSCAVIRCRGFHGFGQAGVKGNRSLHFGAKGLDLETRTRIYRKLNDFGVNATKAQRRTIRLHSAPTKPAMTKPGETRKKKKRGDGLVRSRGTSRKGGEKNALKSYRRSAG